MKSKNNLFNSYLILISLSFFLLLSLYILPSCTDKSKNINKSNKSEKLSVDIYRLSENQSEQSKVGQIYFNNSDYGLIITTSLSNVNPGVHGFHIHENPSCEPSKNQNNEIILGGAAGGHLDPQQTNQHLGPYDTRGHLGDLPALYVNSDGVANIVLLAPKLETKDIINKSIMIHTHGDNYSDSPKSLGGGGHRMYCGVIK